MPVKIKPTASRRLLKFAVFAFIATVGISWSEQKIPDWADVLDLGGSFSVYSYGQAPYNRSAPFLNLTERKLFSDGSEAFTTHRFHDDVPSAGVVPTASANSSSCENCHFRDGRGRVHRSNKYQFGLSVVNASDDKALQIFRFPLANHEDAQQLIDVQWQNAELISLSGGEKIQLIEPVAILPNGAEAQIDLRNAPGVYGLGLLEAIPEKDIREYAAAQKFNPYGVTGRIRVPTNNHESIDQMTIGRFGWKSSFSTLDSQIRHAMTTELGIVTAGNIPQKSEVDVLANELANYVRVLAVPARRLDREKNHRNGAGLFVSTGCTMCHKPMWQTGYAPKLPRQAQSQVIYPFTDMLLHDMGMRLASKVEGKLARYWRTAPLWGAGAQLRVTASAGFLHDGRARTFTEAILWHGGEADYAVRNFKALSPKDRKALIDFLGTL